MRSRLVVFLLCAAMSLCFSSLFATPLPLEGQHDDPADFTGTEDIIDNPDEAGTGPLQWDDPGVDEGEDSIIEGDSLDDGPDTSDGGLDAGFTEGPATTEQQAMEVEEFTR